MRSGVTEAAEKKECRESLGAKQRYSVLHRVFVCGENHEISPETAVFQRFVIDRSGKNRYNDISLTIPEKRRMFPKIRTDYYLFATFICWLHRKQVQILCVMLGILS